MTTIEVILWSIIGGLIVAILSMAAVVYNKEEPNMKHMGRDFIIGAATTGFLYPLIPETFDELKTTISSVDTSTIKDVISQTVNSVSSATGTGLLDPGVKVGPANF